MDYSQFKDDQWIKFIDNHWNQAGTLWGKIEKNFDANRKLWQQHKELTDNIPNGRSKVVDNRIFIDTESVIANLTGRPTPPNVIPGNETEEAKTIANNLQTAFIDLHREIKLKKKLRKGLRWLFFSRLIVLKIFWDEKCQRIDERPVHPLKVRFTPINATNRDEVQVWMEKINTTAQDLLEMFSEKFPESKDKILNSIGYAGRETDLAINNPSVEYMEVWVDGKILVYRFQNIIIGVEQNPYWDWQGVKMLPSEKEEIGQLPGQRKRAKMMDLKKPEFTEYRNQPEAQEKNQYDSYFYNNLDRPYAPYIFGTVFEDDDSPVGGTSLIEQAASLNDEINKRKRQFSDNAEMMNGIIKVDTRLTTITKEDAQRAKANPKGIWYGEGVKEGVIREVGKELPGFLMQDLSHSTQEVDNVMGATAEFRGETNKNETATGRAILREQSFQKLNELVDLIDALYYESYNWQFQLMKVKYTERHFIKVMGKDKAIETLELMQDDFDDGMEVRVIEGQIMPEDRLYKAERASEDARNGLIDPLTYFEQGKGYDNPQEVAKRFIMYKTNPLSIINLNDEDIAALQKAGQTLAAVTPQQAGLPAGAQPDQRANEVAALRQEMETIAASPEFQALPKEEQVRTLEEMQSQVEALTAAV